MLLIADSGSTKTDWMIIHKKEIVYSVQSLGLNPNFLDDREILKAMEESFQKFSKCEMIKSIFFYGSGCGRSENAKRIELSLKKVFINAQIVQVETDMLGAARSLSHQKKSLVCILGTGSNACFFDGKQIVFQVPSYGYLFGDFGSGSDIGKRTLQLFFEKKLPTEIMKAFSEWIQLRDDEILHQVYRLQRPNRFLASIAQFHTLHVSDSMLRSIRLSAFSDFFSRQLNQIQHSDKLELSCCGSVAWHFREEIMNTANEFGIRINTIVANPMPGLIEFHSIN